MTFNIERQSLLNSPKYKCSFFSTPELKEKFKKAEEGDVNYFESYLSSEEHKSEIINSKNEHDKLSVLHYAARNCHYELCDLLINKYEMDISLICNFRLPLHELIDSTKFEPLINLDKVNFINLLTQKTESSKMSFRIDINVKDKNGSTPLLLACQHKHLTAIDHLLSFTKDIDVKIKDKYNRTVLEVFCDGISSEPEKEILDTAKAIINSTSKKDFPDDIILNLLNLIDNTNTDILQNIIIKLLDRINSGNLLRYTNRKLNEIINYKNLELITPIQIAIEKRLLKVTERLLDFGVKQSLPNGESLITLIVKNDSIEILNKLYEKIDLFDYDDKNNNALHVLANSDNQDLITNFFEFSFHVNELKLEILAFQKNDSEEFPINIAILNKRSFIFENLLKKFQRLIDLELDKQGNKVPNLVCQVESLDLLDVFVKNDLASKFTTDLRNKNYQNPFHIATKLNRSLEFIDKLSKIFGDKKYLEQKDDEKNTPFHYAIENKNANILEFLIQFYLSLNKADQNIVRDLFNYAYSVEIFKTLLRYNSDIVETADFKKIIKNIFLRSDIKLVEYLFSKFEINLLEHDINGNSLFHIFAQENSFDTFRYLIRKYKDLNPNLNLKDSLMQKNSKGQTILHIAVEKGHFEFVKEILETNYDFSSNDFRLALIFARNQKEETCIYRASYLLYNSETKFQKKFNDIFNYIYDNYYKTELIFQRAIEGRIEYFQYYFEDFSGAVYFKAKPELKENKKNEDIRSDFINLIKSSKSKDNRLSVLHYAAANFHFNLCKYLIEKYEINVNEKNNQGKTPLHYMIESGKSCDSAFEDNLCGWDEIEVKIVEYFQSKKADLTLKDKNGNSVFDSAVLFKKSKVIAYILKNKNISSEYLLNSLENTLKNSLCDSAKLIIDYIDNTCLLNSMKKDSNVKPLHKICSSRKIDEKSIKESVNLMVHLINKIPGENLDEYLNMKDNYGYTPVHLAIRNNNYDIAKILIENNAKLDLAGGPYNNSAIHFVAQHDNVNMLKLVENKTRLEAKNSKGENAFHLAVIFKRHKFIEELNKFIEINLNDFNSDNMNLLHLCARENNIQSFEFIINKVQQDERILEFTKTTSKHNNNNILHIATENNNYDFISKVLDDNMLTNLIGDKASEIKNELVFAKNNLGQNCFHIAAIKGNRKVLNFLLQNFDPNRLLNSKDNNFNTAFHLACLYSRENIVRNLLKYNLDFNEKNIDFLSPFDICCQNGCMEILKLIFDHNPLNGIININRDHDHIGYPLFSVARSGNTHLLKYLIDKGANLDIKNGQNQNILDVALESDNNEIVECLLQSDKNNFFLNEINNKPELFKKLCINMPTIMKLILNKYLDTENNNCDFELLDPPFEHVQKKSIENHPLFVIAICNHRDLINHDIVKALLNFKWRSFPSIIYYLNLILYFVFLILFTIQLLAHTNLKNNQIEFSNHTNTTLLIVDYIYNRPIWLTTITFVFLALHLLKELYQLFVVNQIRYFYFIENYVEIFTYASSIFYILPLYSGDDYYKTNLQRSLAPLCGLSAWMALALFIQKMPKIGIYGVMFKKMLSKSLKISPIFFIMLIGFSLSFYVQRMTSNRLNMNITSSVLINTLFVMIGEFDNETNKLSMEDSYPRKIIFFFFVTLMCIMILNLLIGITVGEINDIVEEADISLVAMKIKFCLRVQSGVHKFLGEKLENTMRYSEKLIDKNTKDENLYFKIYSAIQKRFNLDQKIKNCKLKIKSYFKKRQKINTKTKDANEKIIKQLNALNKQLEKFEYITYNKLNDLNYAISEIKSDVEMIKTKLNIEN